jgi:hypothetical protein
MGAAAKLNVVRSGRASRRVWLYVMELEERRLAAPARVSDERAASLIAPPHCAPDIRRYVTSHGSPFARRLARGRHAGTLAPLELVDEQRQCTIED